MPLLTIMNWNWKEQRKQKNLFKSYYCPNCRQQKSCGKLDQSFCCSCQYQIERERAEEYSDYQLVYQRKEQEQKERFRQYQLLRDYLGCPQCGSKEADAYHLYNENKLVCQPCRMVKESGASGEISFASESKWYKKRWKIDLKEWMDNYRCLPVNYKCADKWLKDKEHLKNCDCLEQESQELYLLFVNSLKRYEEQLKECKCEISEKVRVSSDDYAWCERCEESIPVASKKRVIKNRNDPKFWGVESEFKILCLECIRKEFYEEMEEWQRKKFREYRRRGYV